MKDSLCKYHRMSSTLNHSFFGSSTASGITVSTVSPAGGGAVLALVGVLAGFWTALEIME